MGSRRAWIAVGLVAVALAAAAYWFQRSAKQTLAPSTELGLAWLPAESVVVASVHVSELRQQTWLVQLAEQAAPVEPETEYREFVAATGFDYSRDLDRLWLGLLPATSGGEIVGIAQGRMEREKIVAYARGQGAQQVSLAGAPAYVIERAEPQLRFAFAFLDEQHIAFAETLRGLEKVLACIRRATPSVMSDAGRRASLERFSAGMQAWAVDEDVARWPPPGLDRRPEVAAQLRRLALGVRTTAEGIELLAEGEAQDPVQAERLKLLLEVYLLAGRALLARREDPVGGALHEAVTQVSVSQEGSWLTLRAKLSRRALAALLAAESLRVSTLQAPRR